MQKPGLTIAKIPSQDPADQSVNTIFRQPAVPVAVYVTDALNVRDALQRCTQGHYTTERLDVVQLTFQDIVFRLRPFHRVTPRRT